VRRPAGGGPEAAKSGWLEAEFETLGDGKIIELIRNVVGVECREGRSDLGQGGRVNGEVVGQEEGPVPVLPVDKFAFGRGLDPPDALFIVGRMSVEADQDPVESVGALQGDETGGIGFGRIPECHRPRSGLEKHVADAHLAHDRDPVRARGPWPQLSVHATS
jgi:hypothetical protein